MYRQITVTNFSFKNIKLLTSNFLHDQNSFIKFRNFYNLTKYDNNYIITTNKIINSLRFNSSQHVNTEVSQIKTQKKRHRYGKFVELLEVGLTTKQIKARVKNLKSKKLSDFIEKSDYLINRHSGKYLLSQLSAEEKSDLKAIKMQNKKDLKLKTKLNKNAKTSKSKKNMMQPIEYQKLNIDIFENSILQIGEYDKKPLIFLKNENQKISDDDVDRIMSSFNNFTEIIETFKSEQEDQNFLSGQLENNLENESIITDKMNTLICDKNKSSWVDQNSEKINKYKSKFHKSLEQEKLAKHKTILINLTSYINVCVTNGMLSRALSTILLYREKCKKIDSSNNFVAIPINLYNVLMHAYAKNAELNKIEIILDILKGDNVKLNHQTFASIFECLGRVHESEENKSLISKYSDRASQLGITLNDIIDKSKFQYDELEVIVGAIKRIAPDFTPHFTEPNLSYSNCLLNSLNTNINFLSDTSNINHDEKELKYHSYSQTQLFEFTREQLKIELEGSVNIKSVEKSADFANSKYFQGKLEDLSELWKSQINAAITRDLNALKAHIRYKPIGIMSYYTYLKALDSKHYVEILLQEIRKLSEGSETFSPTVNQLHKELGQKVQDRYHMEIKKRNGMLEKVGIIYFEYCRQLENKNNKINTRQLWQRLIHKHRKNGPSMDVNDVTWPNNIVIGVGRFLYNILMRDIQIDSNVLRKNSTNSKKNLLPAFYTLYRNHGRLVKEEIKPHPILVRLIRASKLNELTFNANQIPMLCPPQPWSSIVNGGYLLTKSDLIRLPYQAIQQWTTINQLPVGQIYPAFDSLNQLSSIPWRVNTDVLDVILEVFANGGSNKLNVPETPNNLPPLSSIPNSNLKLSKAERTQLYKEKLMRRRKQAEMYSLWCDILYRLSLANHFRDRVFWLPHNMDFRGRVYPIPPHLNHLGSDLARSMLVFDTKKPLGPDGLAWLKLHCINLTGLKKRESIKDRILYADELLDDILDSADNPLTGKKWWLKSDEPWQTLACCMEIAKVIRSPNPEEYISGFPIHQDGSCNGLQHYAALGRDVAGAASVNLSSSEVPQDVYSAIATLVEKTRLNDANNGLQVAQILKDYVKRKVIKQTVMTTVYGVTRYGARLQIARQLKDIEDFPKDWVWPASTYLTAKTFESLRGMFKSAKEIQDWFTNCARYISSICMQNVEWVTPLGLPIVQPYNRIDCVKSKAMRIDETMSFDMYEKPNIMKQKNAFPPNFIHSLDSSHMMLTSLFCENSGITFISVHDCFWTHACTVPIMNKICREQFVALHSQPILENLSNFLVEKYSFQESDLLAVDESNLIVSKKKLNETLRELPQKGEFNLENVLNSVYFFS